MFGNITYRPSGICGDKKCGEVVGCFYLSRASGVIDRI